MTVNILKGPVCPFLEVDFQKFIDSHMQNYIDKVRVIKWNRCDTDCKNEQAIFTRWISFTGPLYSL